MATIKNLLIRIGIDDKKVSSGVSRVNRSLDSIASRVEGLEKLARPAQFAALAGAVLQAGRAFAPLTGALGHLAVAAAPAAGALLAIPAAVAVGKAAIATFKVGVSGVGAAMKAFASGNAKQFNAAMKNLAPNARRFVVVMAQTKNSFDPIRRAVQQRLFAGLAAQMRAVALGALPGLRVGMTDVATQFNGLARAGLSAARSPLFTGTLRAVLGTTAAVLQSFIPVVWPLIQGLARLVKIGLPLVEVFGQWAGRMATLGAVWLNSERTANRFTNAVDRAIGVFRRNGNAASAWQKVMAQFRIVWGQLSRIGRNVWSVIQAVGRAMQNSTQPSKSMLQLITDLTARMAAWANSAKGQQQLSQLFSSLQQLASNLVEILPQLGGVLTLILQLINSLPGPVRDTVLQMLAWSIVLSKFSGPIGGAIKLIGGTGKAIGVLNKVGAGAGKGFAALGKGLGVFGAATGRTAGAFGIAAGNIARTLATAALNVGRAAGSALLSLGRLAVASAVTVARVVAGWVLMGVQSLIQAGRMALAWIIAMGPIAIIIAAVVGLVALIIANWSTVKRWTVAAWNAVAHAVSVAVSWVVNFVSKHWRLLIAIIGGPLGIVVALVSKYWRQIIGFLAGIPGAIGRIFSGAGKWLYDVGKNLIIGLWNGIVSISSWLYNKLVSLVKAIIPGPIRWALGIASPSKVTTELGRYAGLGLAVGLDSTHRVVARSADRLAAAAVPAVGGSAAPAGAVTPAAVMSAASARSRASGAGGGQVRVSFDFGRGNGELKKVFQKIIRVDGGGNVQTALGGT